MGFSTESHSGAMYDPTADVTQVIWRSPEDGSVRTIKSVHGVAGATLAAGTVNGHQMVLLNMGTAGTAVAGTIATVGAPVGGTYPGWAVGEPVAGVIVTGEIDPGTFVALKHDEAGTVAPVNLSVMFDALKGPATL